MPGGIGSPVMQWMLSPMNEHALQNEIRNALAGKCFTFRANVGNGWIGDATKLPDGSVLIRNARPFTTGLPPGFSDLFGFVPVEITPEMVGKTLAVFVAMEVKTKTGRVSPQQSAFLKAVNDNGGRSGVTRSVADALKVIESENLQAK